MTESEAIDKAVEEMAAGSLDVSDDDLAHKIVGLLILDEGNLNKYKRTMLVVIRLLRRIEQLKGERHGPDQRTT